MLLATAVSMLKGPNTLIALLEYIDLFNLNHNRDIKQILWRSCLSLASYYLNYITTLYLSIFCSKLFLYACCSWNFLEISSDSLLCWKFLLLCWHYALCIPVPLYILKIDISCQHNRLKPSENPSCLHAKFILILEVQNHVTL